MTKTKAIPHALFSRDWRANFASLVSEVMASPLATRPMRRSAGRQLAKQMAKNMVKQPPVRRSWRVSRTERRLQARKMARIAELPMVSRQFHFG